MDGRGALRAVAGGQAVTRGLALPLLLAAVLAGCAGPRPSAPVIDRLPSGGASAKPAASKPAAAASGPARAAEAQDDTYTVKRGDTLYSIALDNGQDYREIAQWNNLDNPNLIRIGQVLRVRPPADAAPADGVQVRSIAGSGSVDTRPLGAQAAAAGVAKPAAPAVQATQGGIKTEPRAVKLPYTDENLALLSREPKPAASAPAVVAAAPAKPALELKPAPELKPAAPKPEAAKPPPQPAQQQAKQDDDEDVDWGWPTAGRVAAGFSENTNKGLDISGKTGQPVLASASGTVLYVGTGIRGYGKLLVIRHNKAFSTVYAHNDSILVKEGQRVTKGQKVAEMGNSDADQVKLHFEIRRLGKPVDPAKILPER